MGFVLKKVADFAKGQRETAILRRASRNPIALLPEGTSMTRASRIMRRTASIAALSALAMLNTAVANHFILPCGDECRGGGWVATGSMQSARELHTATLLPTGKVLVAGGRSAHRKALESAELYDPATGSWSATAPMTTR